jgi:hypothetical protein
LKGEKYYVWAVIERGGGITATSFINHLLLGEFLIIDKKEE